MRKYSSEFREVLEQEITEDAPYRSADERLPKRTPQARFEASPDRTIRPLRLQWQRPVACSAGRSAGAQMGRRLSAPILPSASGQEEMCDLFRFSESKVEWLHCHAVPNIAYRAKRNQC
jgi:hypothetical protein